MADSLVVACLTPSDPRPAVDEVAGDVSSDFRRAELSACDAAALEHALRAGEAWGARVVAIAAGPPEIDGVLRDALASGAEVLRVPWSPAGGPELVADMAPLARGLAAAITALGAPALVVCGDRSLARGTGVVPALLSHYLGVAQALGLVSLSIDEAGVSVERRLDGGWRERLRVPTPAVVSVEAAGVRLRRAPLSAALAAAEATIPVAEGVAAGLAGGVAGGVAGAAPRVLARPPRPYRPRTHPVPAPQGNTRDRLLALTGALAAHDPPRIVGPLSGDDAAGELLEFLHRHDYA